MYMYMQPYNIFVSLHMPSNILLVSHDNSNISPISKWGDL